MAWLLYLSDLNRVWLLAKYLADRETSGRGGEIYPGGLVFWVFTPVLLRGVWFLYRLFVGR